MLRLLKDSKDLAVSLNKVKRDLRFTSSMDNAYLETLIRTATGMIENQSGKSLGEKIWQKEVFLKAYRSTVFRVILPNPPILRILAVEENLSRDSYRSIDYLMEEEGHASFILVRIHHPSLIRITYLAGYGSGIEIPLCAKENILTLVQDMCSKRAQGEQAQYKERATL